MGAAARIALKAVKEATENAVKTAKKAGKTGKAIRAATRGAKRAAKIADKAMDAGNANIRAFAKGLSNAAINASVTTSNAITQREITKRRQSDNMAAVAASLGQWNSLIGATPDNSDLTLPGHEGNSGQNSTTEYEQDRS